MVIAHVVQLDNVHDSERSQTMATNKPDEKNPVEPGTDAVPEAGPSRRELLVKGGKVAAGIGVAALLGNLGNWALSYAADKEPIKIGILHSLSGTMAISEVSLRDTVMMAVEEINAKGGGMGRRIHPVVAHPRRNWALVAEQARGSQVEAGPTTTGLISRPITPPFA